MACEGTSNIFVERSLDGPATEGGHVGGHVEIDSCSVLRSGGQKHSRSAPEYREHLLVK